MKSKTAGLENSSAEWEQNPLRPMRLRNHGRRCCVCRSAVPRWKHRKPTCTQGQLCHGLAESTNESPTFSLFAHLQNRFSDSDLIKQVRLSSPSKEHSHHLGSKASSMTHWLIPSLLWGFLRCPDDGSLFVSVRRYVKPS